MPIAINGSGTVTGVSVGGLPDGIVDTDMLASGAVTAAKRGAGAILQVASATKTNTASNALGTQAWWSYTDSSLKATITPISASSKILITGVISVGVDSQQYMMVRLEKNGSRLDAGNGDQDGNKSRMFSGVWYSPETTPVTPYPNFIVQYLDTAGDTNSRYYNFGIAHTSGLTRTIYLNRGGSTTNSFNTMQCASTITAQEIAA
tara:strand:+ start:244 stop:858 length:615 start_codon:yes stop_codon:yes gene_type:complete